MRLKYTAIDSRNLKYSYRMNGAGGLAMRFSILDIWADGYERIAHIRSINSGSEFLSVLLSMTNTSTQVKAVKGLLALR